MDDPTCSAHSIEFDRYELEIGIAKRQTVLPAYLLGDEVAELIVVNGETRRLQVFEPDGHAKQPILDESIRDEVLFVDVANISGRDRLIMYTRDRFIWYDPDSNTEHAMLTVNSSYEPSTARAIPHVDVTRDVNGDGLDDLVIPGSAALKVYIQTKDGKFGDSVRLAHSHNLRWTDKTNPWLQSTVQLVDLNQDDREDLMFWTGNHFALYLQNENGLFEPSPIQLATGIPADGWAHYSLSIVEGDAGSPPGERKRVIRACEDLNDDGIIDLVIVSLKGSNVFTFHSVYELHFGRKKSDGGLAFVGEPDVTIRSNGLQMGMRQQDIDGDGQVDLMLITCNNLGMFKMVGGMLTGSMALDLELYQMKDGIYPEAPTARRRIKGVFNEDSYYQAVLLTDVSGDGRSDLIVQQGREKLHIYAGDSIRGLFAARHKKINATLPDNERDTRLVDLNRDGRQDLLMHRRYTDCYWLTTNPHEPNHVTLLISRHDRPAK